MEHIRYHLQKLLRQMFVIPRNPLIKEVAGCLFFLFLGLFVVNISSTCAQQVSPSSSEPSAVSENLPENVPDELFESLPEETEELGGEPSELSLFEEIPMVVTASKKPERITAAPSIISVITQEDIERMGARTLMDVLRTVPGIEITKDAMDTSQITVRGLREASSPGIKIFIDGHTINDPVTGGATTFYYDLPLKNVQRIEIIRGPASALYGANAFVSVVNIITKNAQEIDGAEAVFGVGSFDTYNPAFLFGKILDDFEMTFYADYNTTNGAPLFVEADALSMYDAALGPSGIEPLSLAPGTYRVERERIDLSLKMSYHDFTFHGKFLERQRGPFLTSFYALNDSSHEDVRHIYADLEYRRYLTERLEFNGRIYADDFLLDFKQQVGQGLRLPVEKETGREFIEFQHGLLSEASAKSQRVGGEGVLDFRLFKNNDLTLGATYEYFAVDDVVYRTNEFAPLLGTDPNQPEDIQNIFQNVKLSSFQHFAAIFAQDTWQIRPDVDLTLGLRGDYFSEFGGVLTPKVGITYEPSRQWNFKALFGSAFRIPSFTESFLAEATLAEGETDESSGTLGKLVVEELRTFELGLGYKPLEWLVGELNYFYTDINQLAETADEEEDTGEYPIGTSRVYQNVGGIDVHGFEAEIQGKSAKEIGLGIIPRIMSSTFWINYSFQDAKDSDTHRPVPDIARHKGNIGINFNLSAAEDSHDTLGVFRTFSDEFSLYFNLFLCGERLRSPDDLRDPLPAYGILDMTLTAYDLFDRGLDFSFSIKNLLDEEYHDPSPEFAEDSVFSTIPGDFPTPGRSFFVEFRYKF